MKPFLAFLFAFSFQFLQAQSGTLDKSFGDTGVVVSQNFGGTCQDVLIQNDGKIISVGTGRKTTGFDGFLLARYNLNGTPDLNFGDSGKVVTYLSPYGSSGYYGALQEDGKILVVGNVVPNRRLENDVAIVRYNVNGSIDSSFGNNGKVVAGENIKGWFKDVSGIVVQPDDKIVIAGKAEDERGEDGEDPNPTIYIIRYNVDGSLDPAFADKGTYQVTIDNALIHIAVLALQPDGKIVVGGDNPIPTGKPFFIRRYTKGGAPDVEFGTNGEARFNFKEADYGSKLNSIAIQKDGKIVSAGSTYYSVDGGQPRATMVRFNGDGSADESFGSAGLVVSPFGSTGSELQEIALRPNGRIVAAGNSINIYTGALAFAAVRYESDGSFDSSFGDNGVQLTFLKEPHANAVALQKDGKIIVGGDLLDRSGFPYDFIALARYNVEDKERRPLIVKIIRWLHNHGIGWKGENGNVAYYSVEKRSNLCFKEVARINKNNSQDYNYIIPSSNSTTSSSTEYYRIRELSTTGQSNYSNIVALSSLSSPTIYPNPVKGRLTINNLDRNSTSKITIADVNGTVWLTTVARQQSTAKFDVSKLKSGSYFLTITNGEKSNALKFVKE